MEGEELGQRNQAARRDRLPEPRMAQRHVTKEAAPRSEPNLRLTKVFRVRIVVPLTFMGSSLAPPAGRRSRSGGRLAKYHSPRRTIKASATNARVRVSRRSYDHAVFAHQQQILLMALQADRPRWGCAASSHPTAGRISMSVEPLERGGGCEAGRRRWGDAVQRSGGDAPRRARRARVRKRLRQGVPLQDRPADRGVAVVVTPSLLRAEGHFDAALAVREGRAALAVFGRWRARALVIWPHFSRVDFAPRNVMGMPLTTEEYPPA